MFSSIKSIRKFQIQGIKKIQLSIFFNASVKIMTNLNHSLLDNTWYYLSKSGKVKITQIKKPEYSIPCTIQGKSVFMTPIEINGKLTPLFQPIEGKLVYEDLICIPKC